MIDAKPEHRFYRHKLQATDLVDFQVVVKETDLHIHAEKNLDSIARDVVIDLRGYIEAYIAKHPQFVETLTPMDVAEPVPVIIQDMAQAAASAGVGPMASVAGAIAAHVGQALTAYSAEVIVENGGDIFLVTKQPLTMGIYAGQSPLSLRLGLTIGGRNQPVSVCTSSGTVGHSLSMGRADAVCVIANDCALADAVATATGNRVQQTGDIQQAIKFGQTVKGVDGLIVIVEEQIGVWGDVELVPLSSSD
jgi:ApbE superfamily uncharacterized protein (UPF0280 family)